MATKRQTTFAKLNRERAVKEKRARKQEKKDARRAEAAEEATGTADREVAPDSTEEAD